MEVTMNTEGATAIIGRWREGFDTQAFIGAGTVLRIDAEPVRVDESFTDYMRHVGGLQEGEWVYALTLDIPCPDGVHAA